MCSLTWSSTAKSSDALLLGQVLQPAIGIRAALGASRCHIIARVTGQGLGLTLTDISVVTTLAAVAGLASAVPAWSAVRIDPAGTL